MLINPHNPIGKLWTKEELFEISDFCKKDDLIILSDDIHQDLVFSDKKYIPIHSISEEIATRTITFLSPCKTFNISGVQTSCIVISNKEIRDKITYFMKRNNMYNPSIFAIEAFCSAYQKGELWLKSLLSYLRNNFLFLQRNLIKFYPFIKLVPSDATYLAWLDFRGLLLSNEIIEKILVDEFFIILEIW